MPSLLDLPLELLDMIIDDHLQPGLKQLTQIAATCKGLHVWLRPRLTEYLAFSDREDSIRTAFRRAEESGHLVKALHFTSVLGFDEHSSRPRRRPYPRNGRKELGEMVCALLSGRLLPRLKTVTLRMALEEASDDQATDGAVVSQQSRSDDGPVLVETFPAYLSLLRNPTVRRLILVDAAHVLGHELSYYSRLSHQDCRVERDGFFSRLDSLRIASIDGYARSSTVPIVSRIITRQFPVRFDDHYYIPDISACITNLEIAPQRGYQDTHSLFNQMFPWDSREDPFPNLKRLRLDHVCIDGSLMVFLCRRARTLQTLEMWDCWADTERHCLRLHGQRAFTWHALLSAFAAREPVLERLVIHPDGLSYYLPEAFTCRNNLLYHLMAVWPGIRSFKRGWDAVADLCRETRRHLGIRHAFSYAQVGRTSDLLWRLTGKTLDRMDGEDLEAYRKLDDIVRRNTANGGSGTRREKPFGLSWIEADYEAWFREPMQWMDRKREFQRARTLCRMK